MAGEQQSSAQLEESLRAARELEGRVHDLQDELAKSGKQLEGLTAREQTVNERLKQKVRSASPPGSASISDHCG